MNEFWIGVILISILIVAIAIFGALRYNFIINPLVVFAVFDIGVMTLLSALVVNHFSKINNNGLENVFYLSTVYIAGFFLVFYPKQLRFSYLLFDKLRNFIRNKSSIVNYSVLNQIILIALAFNIFIMLMLASGAGTLWITSPREAYQFYRKGVGFLFIMVQWSMLIPLLYYFFVFRPPLVKIVIATCIYVIATYFIGSKCVVLSGVVMAGVYYNFFIKELSIGWIVLGLFVIFGSVLFLLFLHGSYNIFELLLYFRDYAGTTGEFLNNFNKFSLQYGYGMLSDLWFYVPRALIPSKPFEYGITLIHKVLYPGSAATGHTPGVLPWALAYLDFGVIGVFTAGIISGIIRRCSYELFLVNRQSVFAFVLMVQLSIFPIFAYATLPMIIIIAVFLTLFFRIKIEYV